jgi:hypothetical protein
MPDQFGFDNLPQQGCLTHRCVECGFPGPGRTVSEADRKRHQDGHERQRQKDAARIRKTNAANARKAKAALARENTKANRQKGHE